MSAFALIRRHEDWFAVMHGGRRVAILTPARPARRWPPAPAERWSIVPDPAEFPDPACTGLPAPLSPAGNPFDSYEDAASFLGIAAPEGLEARAA